ncbi:hypothetical protein SZ15_05370, partial [Vibrio parahaemolyticus]|uniref:hypothetical protein n=1 Tax=Vibrio parahaemolyticus TaxID=670 RepID=UPI0005C13143
LEADLEQMKANAEAASDIVQEHNEVMEKLRTIFAEVDGSEDWTMDDFLKYIKDRNFGLQVRTQGDRNVSGNSLAEELATHDLDEDEELEYEDDSNRPSAEFTERLMTDRQLTQSEFYDNLMLELDKFHDDT